MFPSVVEFEFEFELAICLFLCGLKGLLNGIWDLGSKWDAFVVAIGRCSVALVRWWLLFCFWCIRDCYVALVSDVVRDVVRGATFTLSYLPTNILNTSSKARL